MSWDAFADLPATRLYVDQHGNVRRRSIETGRFVTGTIAPDYGEAGYGATVELSATLTEGSE